MTPSDLRTLIEALESAPVGSGEINDRIAEALDWECDPDLGVWSDRRTWSRVHFDAVLPDWSRSIDAALPGEEIVATQRSSDGTAWWATGAPCDDGWEPIGKAATEPLAHRAAYFRAKLHEMETDNG